MNKHFWSIVPAVITLGLMGCCNVSLSTVFTGKSMLSSVMMPALAAVSGIGGMVLMSMYMILKFSSGKMLITKGLPTLAAIYSAQCTAPSWRSALLNIGIPVAAATAFVVHPVGHIAWVYSLFWIIPVGGELLRIKGVTSLFNRLLTGTFIAHAVGSVIWLYLVPTTAATWFALLTIVPVERFVFASGATLVALGIGMIKNLFCHNSINSSKDLFL